MVLRGLHCDALFHIHERLISFRLTHTYLALKDLSLRFRTDKEVANFRYSWDRKLNWCERVKRDLFGCTVWARKWRLELTLQEVNDDGLVSSKMSFPKSIGNLCVIAGELWHFYILLLFNSIQIFMQLIEYPAHEFHRVLLVEALKRCIRVSNYFLERGWLVSLIVSTTLFFAPKWVDALCEPWCHFALTSKWIVHIDLVTELHW